MSSTILTTEDIEKLAEIQRLLDEGLEHYLTYESHCKSSEGYVTVTLSNSWQRRAGENPIGVEVYSYALGPSRSHFFDSIDEALAEVQGWHKEEMAYVPDEDYEEAKTEIARNFIEAMGDRWLDDVKDNAWARGYNEGYSTAEKRSKAGSQ